MDKRYSKRMTQYWNRSHAKAVSMIDSLDWEGWFDLWHLHYDKKAKGNRIENRFCSNFLGYELLKLIEQYCSNRTKPSQCFLCVYPDVNDDAIYVHTENPNPNSIGFPYDFSEVIWGATDNSVLNSLVNLKTHQIGKVDTGEYKYHIVIKKT